jgi:two-component system cell cycle response regulator
MDDHIEPTLPRILIVDDSRIVRATVKKHLHEVYDILEEADGEAGWQRLQGDEQIQLLISDLTMPHLDGMGLLARVRASEDSRIRSTPVIIISGEEDAETKEKAVQAGANDFITKSTDRAEMLARVNANIALGKKARELEASRQQTEILQDPLTGLATAQLLQLQTGQALAFAQRHRSQVSLLLLEIDALEDFTRQYGRPLAEQMVKLLAKLLASKLRKEDTIARVGEARFGILSPATSAGDERIVAERLRHAIAGAKINFRGQVLRVSASIGMACYGQDLCDSLESLQATAERRLQHALQSGGNQVVLVDPVPQVDEAALAALGQTLKLVVEGREREVRGSIPAVMRTLLPLLVLANDELSLDMDMRRIKERVLD